MYFKPFKTNGGGLMTRWGKCLVLALAVVLAVGAHASAKDALTINSAGVLSAKLSPNSDTWTVTVPLSISNTKDLAAIDLPIKFANQGDGINLLEVSFEEGRAHYFDIQVANIDNENKTVLIGLLWMAFNKEQTELKAGEGPLATLTFEVTDPSIEQIVLEPTNFTNPHHSVSFIYNEVGGDGMLHVGELTPELEGWVIPVTQQKAALPKEWALNQNYPNPFNATTMISFALPKPGNVRLDVFNILGQRVTTLKNEFMEAGIHNVSWKSTDIASGVYFYRLQASDFTKTRKMTLLK